MTVSALAHPTAPTTNEAEAARLLLLAHNSLSQALRSIRRTDTTPDVESQRKLGHFWGGSH